MYQQFISSLCAIISKLIFVSLIFFISTPSLSAQDTLAVSPPISTEKTPEKPPPKKNKFTLKDYFKKGYPDPKKAVTLAIIPGLGQIYNKKYWKLPIVYGALGGVIYSIDYNTKRYEIFRRIYDAKTNKESIYEDTLPTISPSAIKAQRDAFDKNKQLSWIGVLGFYLISAGEAFTDAHLKDFNVDDDISWQPSIQPNPFQSATIGVSVKIKISK